MHFLAALLVALLAVLPASAQVAPTETELRAYGGLHAAAARGDVADIEKRASLLAKTRKRSTRVVARRCMSRSIRSSTMPRAP